MSLMVPQLRLLSNVGFPALYQGLFSYLLLLGNAGGTLSGLSTGLILGTSVIGIPLTMAFNLSSLEKRCASTLLLISRPVLAAMVLPLGQLLLLAVIPQLAAWSR